MKIGSIVAAIDAGMDGMAPLFDCPDNSFDNFLSGLMRQLPLRNQCSVVSCILVYPYSRADWGYFDGVGVAESLISLGG